ncbi:hypothetical protein PN462_12960 [Spirulina sp. CS-785/01]|uniref:hypothetical protein n=1 Tax=Spirulina sp. CS-785/01 TaxID=3021716 RepID=UPI00232F5979|nr:hypothetical protein [Spirulina sp. CS-785/01]MDB9314016.1 hypothetical protein [Spirulina sp. CS-785/01]
MRLKRVQTRAISEHITLKYWRDNFGLQRTKTPDFFPEWQESLPSLSPQSES